MQSGSFVYGIEADGGWAGIEDDIDDVTVDWTSTVRGRIGYAFDSVLVYATGGAAIGGVDSDIIGDGDTRLGFAVGGGVEAALTDNISAKVEYQYIDLGDDDIDGSPVEFDAHTVKAGLNFHF
jgi:outer membrane immunogenic protein